MLLIKSYLMSMNRETLLLGVGLVLYSIVLIYSFKVTEKKKRKLLNVTLCFLPFIVCLLHFKEHYLKGLLLYSLKLYLPLYMGAVIMLVLPFIRKWKVGARITKLLTIPVTCLGVLISMMIILVIEWVNVIGNGTQMNYVESFELLTNEMEAHYVLNDWKEIDYRKIKDELMPKVKEAEARQDEEAFYEVLLEYVNHFHDGHIWLEAYTDKGIEVRNNVNKRFTGKDYGFSLYTIDTGETIAVLVEPGCEAEKNGIADGTIITKWNGMPIREAIENANYFPYDRDPVLENFIQKEPIYFAGMGEDTLQVSFMNPSGEEETIALNAIGDYEKRQKYALECLFHEYHVPVTEEIMNMSDDEIEAFIADIKTNNENFFSKMISEDCGYIRINSEEINVLQDTWAEITDSYPAVSKRVDEKLEELKAQGMKQLIIDARNNGGGYPSIIYAIVSLFTREEIDMGYNCYQDYVTGETHFIADCKVKANGKWADLPVIVLANSESGSSGDGLVYALSQCPNVTTMGSSNTQGMYQSVGAICFLTDGDFAIRYPMFPSLDREGNPMIDTSADQICRIPLEEKIPITREAALEIFQRGENDELDYEIRYGMEQFEDGK